MAERWTAEAGRAAERAARSAGVRVAELTALPDLREAVALIDRVWRPPAGSPLATTELLLVIGHAGGYVVGVHEGDRMIGACVGLLSRDGLHSHIAGVADGARGRSAGYALKLHQRAWAARHGITAVTWTFDPLVSRNAYFNLAKLGARPAAYLPDFYGPMHDEVNAGDDSDRLLVRWDLADPRVAAACAGRPHAADPGPAPVVGLDAKPDGGPAAGRCDGDVVLVRVPRDMEALRAADPPAARAWRHAVREVLGGLLAEGRTVTGFTREGWYVVERDAR